MAQLNKEQEKAVLQMDNAVIAAGAGSGKTFVLAQRYSHLVLEKGFTVDQILTLTFTNKAAAEMYQRIYKTLFEFSQKNPDNKRAKLAVQNFSEARIQTLDSYCSSIIKLASRHYGIRPDFSVDDETCVNYAYKQAIPFLLNNRNNKAIIELINNSSIENLAENLFAKTITQYSNLANPIDFDKLLGKQTEIAKTEWNKITEIIEILINTIQELTTTFEGKPQKIILSIRQIIEENENPVYPDFDSLIDFYKTHSEIASINESLKNFLDYVNLFNQISLQGRTTNETAQEIKNNIKELKNNFSLLCSISSFIANYKISEIIYPLLDEFQKQINEYKRTSGILTFQDISHLAVDVLINHPEIRNIEKSSFKAIMIDEFQDDNQLQRDLLFLLAEKYERNEKSIPNPEELCPDKLFFVGDEKQSIYKFRGADVSVFRKLKTELANNSNLSLITNYRSHPALIAGFNSLFGGYKYPDKIEELEKPTERFLHKASLFLNDKQITDNKKVPDFEATYDWVKPNLTDKEGNPLEINLEPRIHFSVFNNTKNDNNEIEEENIIEDLNTPEIEAMYVAQKIKSLIDEKKYQNKDFAILFRSTTKQYLYEKHLRKFGIPYTSESVVGFFNESPINNIYYLLRLLVYPTDMVAYENLLFSPFVNLSQTGVNICMIHTAEKIKLQRNQINPEEILFSNEIENLLSEDDLQNYQNGKILFTELSEKIKTLSLTEIICELWYNLGNRYETLWCDTVSVYNEMYDYLFEIANQSDENGLGLSEFVDNLETLKANNERLSDMDIPLEKPDAVRLMTIHKSKGLEFPVIFVCGCSSPGKKETSSDVVYYNEENGISLNIKSPYWFAQSTQNFFYIKSKDLNTLKREAELRRVLYVAMTRAEKELYLISNFKLNVKVKDKIIETQQNENFDFTKKDFSHEELLEFFSLMATTKIEEKQKEILTNQLAQSKCITNDTFMGFMLYAISEWNKDGEGKFPNCPFKLESINIEIQEDENFEKRKPVEQLICEIKSEYENAQIIQTETTDNKYISPSTLSTHGEFTEKELEEKSTHKNSQIEVDKIIQSFENKEFSYDKFGTIAHAFAESIFTKEEPKIPSHLTQMLSEKQKEKVFEIAQSMAQKFYDSELGKMAQVSPWRKNEYDFKLLVKENSKIGNAEFQNKGIMSGQIDLVFQDSKDKEKFIVVDFKTDTDEIPEIHFNQLESYRLAVSKFKNTSLSNVKCFLFYLRSGHFVEVK